MQPHPLLIRALIAALLAGAAVWAASAPAPDAAPVGPAPRIAAAPPHPSSPTGADAARLRADVAAILARPLFRDDRRPVRAAAVAPGAEATSDGLPRLSGILFNGEIGEAIFEGEGKPRVTRVGDHVGPYVVAAITPVSVVVRGPDGERTLRTAYTATAPAKAGASDARAPMPSLLDQLAHGTAPSLPVPPPPTLSQLRDRHRATRQN